VDTSSCCDQPPAYPNLTTAAAAQATPTETPTPTPTPTATPTPAGPVGGGKVGLLLISPLVQRNSSYALGSFNHFSLLKSIEDAFKLPPVGYAADDALPAFDKAVYNAKPS
jgi:hypothetical protein